MVDKIDYVNALNDNYIWLLIKGNHVIAIDPGEASPTQMAIKFTLPTLKESSSRIIIMITLVELMN